MKYDTLPFFFLSHVEQPMMTDSTKEARKRPDEEEFTHSWNSETRARVKIPCRESLT
ncbi:TPA: hypothetical protein HA274_03650 [Candidatus Bathyarchaeota archaeon]|nr:hypothetical protein [Candidatus Bathyarchaeota archaeon]